MDKFPPLKEGIVSLYLGGFLSTLLCTKCDEAVPSIELSKWIHHKTQIPDFSTLFKQWN